MNPAHNEHIYRIRLPHDTDREYWAWCKENLDTDSWHMKFAIAGTSCSYYFKLEEDAMAFKLKFGL